jgi:small subunit ribosomal protein S21
MRFVVIFPYSELVYQNILTEVQVRFNNVEYSLKMLKRKLQREGVFKMMREKRHYEKPSEKKLRKSIEAKKRKHKIHKNKLYK